MDVSHLPLSPGVYQFYDSSGRLLYIGKATHLRQRVGSYFRTSTALSPAKQHMVSLIHELKYTVVDTEPEALLLETTLIKKYKPPYNVVMKDDKNFQYIHITNDLFPRIVTTRKIPRAREGGKFFGPYTSGFAVRSTLRLLKTLFRFCTTPPVVRNGVVLYPKRPCLDYHLGRCIGPCAKAVTPQQYQAIFTQVEQFFSGEYAAIEENLHAKMDEAARAEQFEQAAVLRDQWQSLHKLMGEQKMVSTKREYADFLSLARLGPLAAVNVFTVRGGVLLHQEVFSLTHTVGQDDHDVLSAFCDQYYAGGVPKPARTYLNTQPRRGRNRKLLELGVTNALQSLQRQKQSAGERDKRAQDGLRELGEAIGIAPEKLHRIETYDISHFQGKFKVGSMVVFIDGQSAPKEYRKFKIKTVQGSNDFASLQEVLDRRLGHLPERARSREPWPVPDLLVIDGGKGQLSSVKAVMDAIGCTIPVISLAKEEEEIFVPGSSVSIRLPRESAGLHLMQHMRDEAHRFAIGFYRSRHLKDLV